MWGMATLAIEVSRASMKVASVTVTAMAHGLARGRHVSWKEGVAVAATQKTSSTDAARRADARCTFGYHQITEYGAGKSGIPVWHSGYGMGNVKSTANLQRHKVAGLLLGIDTCGPSGSVALGRLSDEGLEVLSQKALASRSYSATLVSAVGELLQAAQARLADVAAMVAVNGPGSFTGVRVGLGAVKGLAEPGGIPVIAVSRLAVLAAKAGVDSAALDAHRHEVFLRLADRVAEARELLAGAAELAAIKKRPEQAAVCDDAAEVLLRSVWPGSELVRVAAPTAADAIRMAVPQFQLGEFVDLVLLDGHYLRRSDAEIFGEPATTVGRTK